MIQSCTNNSSHSEPLNVEQIFQRCIIPWLYKSLEVVQILQRSKKLFNVVQIIQRNEIHSTQCESFNAVLQTIQLCGNNSTLYTNHSTQFKFFNVVQIIQRSASHSTQYKSFNAVQIIIERCTNLSRLSPDLLVIYDSVVQQS